MTWEKETVRTTAGNSMTRLKDENGNYRYQDSDGKFLEKQSGQNKFNSMKQWEATKVAVPKGDNDIEFKEVPRKAITGEGGPMAQLNTQRDRMPQDRGEIELSYEVAGNEYTAYQANANELLDSFKKAVEQGESPVHYITN